MAARKPIRGKKKTRRRLRRRLAMNDILGPHPVGDPFGAILDASDGWTKTKVPHRALMEKEGARGDTVQALREMLSRHHMSAEARARLAEQAAALADLGVDPAEVGIRAFPQNSDTQKGNLAEVVLAEYLTSEDRLTLPVYRLRYNPNVDQSMKGDDVLAFDLDCDPPRIVVGEAKFRSSSTTAVVKELVESLVRSHHAGVPVSLQFVAERLFESGEQELGTRVFNCARLFALGQLRLDYVGLLVSDVHAAKRIDAGTENSLRRLVVLSLSLEEQLQLVEDCYEGLE